MKLVKITIYRGDFGTGVKHEISLEGFTLTTFEHYHIREALHALLRIFPESEQDDEE